MTIGLFDSGVGGLTCLRALLETFPNQNYIYLGDTARLPYGTKSQDTIKLYALQNIHFLKSKNVDVIISACHSASSAILNFNIAPKTPLYEVISPACAQIEAAMGTVGVIATPSTVHSQIYPNAIRKAFPNIAVEQMACPLLVPLVENGWIHDVITDQILERYLTPLMEKNIQALILGCTHFPVLEEAISRILGPHVKLIDPGKALAATLMGQLRPLKPAPKRASLYITDEAPHFIKLAHSLLPKDFAITIEHCHL